MELWTWLRMSNAGSINTPTWQPTCEASYNANIALFSAACPTNGGDLQADGTWLQQPWKINTPWPQSVPTLAVNNGQKYYPIISNSRTGVLAVLDDESLQSAAADNLIATLDSRFDRASINGVMLDLEKIPSSRKDALSRFYEKLYRRLNDAGLTCIASIRSHDGSGRDYDDAYCYDLNAIRQHCDFMEIRQYGYWAPAPRSVGPEWWIRASIEYALAAGVSPSRMLLGVGSMANWHEHGDPSVKVQIPTDSARNLAESRQWVGSNANGLVSEEYGVSGDGYVWMSSGDTLSRRLALVDEYRLKGASLFIPSHCSSDHWAELERWLASHQ